MATRCCTPACRGGSGLLGSLGAEGSTWRSMFTKASASPGWITTAFDQRRARASELTPVEALDRESDPPLVRLQRGGLFRGYRPGSGSGAWAARGRGATGSGRAPQSAGASARARLLAGNMLPTALPVCRINLPMRAGEAR
jgi:hypothetical protein